MSGFEDILLCSLPDARNSAGSHSGGAPLAKILGGEGRAWSATRGRDFPARAPEELSSRHSDTLGRWVSAKKAQPRRRCLNFAFFVLLFVFCFLFNWSPVNTEYSSALRTAIPNQKAATSAGRTCPLTSKTSSPDSKGSWSRRFRGFFVAFFVAFFFSRSFFAASFVAFFSSRRLFAVSFASSPGAVSGAVLRSGFLCKTGKFSTEARKLRGGGRNYSWL